MNQYVTSLEDSKRLEPYAKYLGEPEFWWCFDPHFHMKGWYLENSPATYIKKLIPAYLAQQIMATLPQYILIKDFKSKFIRVGNEFFYGNTLTALTDAFLFCAENNLLKGRK